jgi:putative protein-disulfide isomerase
MNEQCDLVNGHCAPSNFEALSQLGTSPTNKTELIYIGDPMCSWCWGIAPALKQLRNHYAKQNVPFGILAGGLRPGGGEPWDDAMKSLLKHHWSEVEKRSGQPFGYALLERDTFNYDTEPACRAVVTARTMMNENLLSFFEAIQYKFYVLSEDPGNLSFYESICAQFGLDFTAFSTTFEQDEMRLATRDEFQLNRQWGVTGYPTVVLSHNNQLFSLAHGYAPFEAMHEVVERIFAAEKQ